MANQRWKRGLQEGVLLNQALPADMFGSMDGTMAVCGLAFAAPPPPETSQFRNMCNVLAAQAENKGLFPDGLPQLMWGVLPELSRCTNQEQVVNLGVQHMQAPCIEV